MSKKILIVEKSDTALAATLRPVLEGRGFTVEDTADGKGSVEQIRRDRPDLVVLAVELSAGQNGYLICGKLKKDDDLKNVPIVIVGNPDGFAQHRKLKAHADEYVPMPVDANLLTERVGAIIGFPEVAVSEDVVDESLTLDALGDEPMTADFGEEISVDTGEDEEPAVAGEELDLDAAFSDMSSPEPEPAAIVEEPVEAPPDAVVEGVEEDFSGLDALGSDADDALDSLDDSEKTVVGFMPVATAPVAPAPLKVIEPPKATTPPPARMPTPPARTPAVATSAPVAAAPVTSAVDAAELRGLRAKVAELQAALEDSRGTASQAEDRVRELEAELEGKATELETARAATGKNDKDTFALRDAVNKRDKEILRLKTELNQKDQEIVELKDQHLELEQASSTTESEMARRDAQIKTLTTRVDTLTAERKRVDQQLATSKEEARGAAAQVTTLQEELDQQAAQTAGLNAELEELRNRTGQLEVDVQTAREEADTLRGQVESAQREAEELRSQLEQTQTELSAQGTRAAEEADELRRRIAELEATAVRNEERVTKLYARIKNDEKLREKTKKALAIAQQLLEENASSVADDADEAAA
ncbi:response regulator [Myxococcus faecalis]|uniref:response regulator n=1 Tax=Myxococcus faecalis TaxID=3115646 RepID=UPI003CF27204